MKKVLLLIIMLMCLNRVSAKTYYSDYGDYIDNKDIIIKSSDVVDVIEEKYYALYKENIRYDYLEKSNYETTGNVLKKETNWVNNIKLVDSSKVIEKKYQYTYPISKKYKFIVFESTSEKSINIEKLTIYNKAYDKKYFDVKDVIINKTEKLIVDLEDNFNFSEIEIDLSLKSPVSLQPFYVTMNIYVCDDTSEIYKGVFLSSIIGDYTKASYKVRDYSNEKRLFHTNPLKYTIETASRKSYLGEEEILYRNVYYLKEYKIIEREYSGDYSRNEVDGYQLDKKLVKTNYKYRIRDKVEINDALVIDNYNKNLIDLIRYSTIPLEKIKITSNINYKVNGNYNINFILPFKTITSNVSVNIKENYLNMLNNQTKRIKDLEEALKISSSLVNKKNMEIKDVIKIEETKTKDLVNSLNKCIKENKDIKNQKEVLYEEKEVKEQSISFIYVLLSLIIILTMYKLKYIKKNN